MNVFWYGYMLVGALVTCFLNLPTVAMNANDIRECIRKLNDGILQPREIRLKEETVLGKKILVPLADEKPGKSDNTGDNELGGFKEIQLLDEKIVLFYAKHLDIKSVHLKEVALLDTKILIPEELNLVVGTTSLKKRGAKRLVAPEIVSQGGEIPVVAARKIIRVLEKEVFVPINVELSVIEYAGRKVLVPHVVGMSDLAVKNLILGKYLKLKKINFLGKKVLVPGNFDFKEISSADISNLADNILVLSKKVFVSKESVDVQKMTAKVFVPLNFLPENRTEFMRINGQFQDWVILTETSMKMLIDDTIIRNKTSKEFSDDALKDLVSLYVLLTRLSREILEPLRKMINEDDYSKKTVATYRRKMKDETALTLTAFLYEVQSPKNKELEHRAELAMMCDMVYFLTNISRYLREFFDWKSVLGDKKGTVSKKELIQEFRRESLRSRAQSLYRQEEEKKKSEQHDRL